MRADEVAAALKYDEAGPDADDRIKRATLFNWLENLRLVTTDEREHFGRDSWPSPAVFRLLSSNTRSARFFVRYSAKTGSYTPNHRSAVQATFFIIWPATHIVSPFRTIESWPSKMVRLPSGGRTMRTAATEADDGHGRRVPAPVSSSCAAAWLCPHSLLRLFGQSTADVLFTALPTTAGNGNSTARYVPA